MQTETLPDAETLDRRLCGELGLAAQLLNITVGIQGGRR